MESHCYAPMSGTRRSSLPLSFSFSLHLSLSLSLSAAAPPSRSSERDGESWAKEKTDGEREDKRRDTETLIITLAFMCASQGGVLASPVVLFLASAFTRLSS